MWARGRAEMVWRRGVMDGCANTMGGVNYTDEQVDTVREIKGKKDYYIILGVGKDSSVKEIRKAYRKLCLKVHPDKNKAPGADEAFKLLSNAFQCLSDDEMRRKYDETGPGHELHRWSYGDGCGCDDGSFYSGRRRSGAEGGFNFLVLLQILPMFILFLVSYLPYSEPNYALQQTVVYQFGKITKAHGVSFYVKLADFDREYPPESSARLGLEIQVERDYKIDLERYCHIELQRCQWGLAFETPHCDKLKRFEAA